MKKHMKRRKKIIIWMCLFVLVMFAFILTLSYVLPEVLSKHIDQLQLGEVAVEVIPPKTEATLLLSIVYFAISVFGIRVLAPDLEALLWLKEKKKAIKNKR